MKAVGAILITTDMREREEMLAWAGNRLHMTFPVKQSYPLGVVRKGKLVAVWVYHEHQNPGVLLSVAADNPTWCTKEMLKALLGWPFRVLQVRRITIMIEKINKRPLRIAAGDSRRKDSKGAGFVREGVIRKGSKRGHDIVLLGMLREDYEQRYCRPTLAKAA